MDNQVAKIETVLPSWRFLVSEQMEKEAKRFFMIIESFPLVGGPYPHDKLATAHVKDLPEFYPLIARADARLGGCVSDALKHLGAFDHDHRQPGYIFLLGKVFSEARRLGDPEIIIKRCRGFIAYNEPRTNAPTPLKVLKAKPTPEYPGFEHALNGDGTAMSRSVKAKLHAKEKYVTR